MVRLVVQPSSSMLVNIMDFLCSLTMQLLAKEQLYRRLLVWRLESAMRGRKIR